MGVDCDICSGRGHINGKKCWKCRSTKKAKKNFTFQCPVSLSSRLKQQSKREDRSQSEIIRSLIRNYLDEVEPEVQDSNKDESDSEGVQF